MADGTTSSLALISDAQAGAPPLEARPPEEAAAIQTLVGLIEAQVRADAAADPHGTARRDAHPKAHGLVKAEFRVLDGLPSDLAAGLFARPATHQAWVRFSNGSRARQDDAKGDGRGMAIKVMGVTGSASRTQDFLLVSGPAFFVRDAAGYVDFQRASNVVLGFFLNPLKLRLHELLMALAITRQKISNPLNGRYFSMAPFLCGDIAVKFQARPVEPLSSYETRVGPSFLRRNLMQALADSEAVFDFCVQRRTIPETMPVEDPTVVWSEADSPPIPVARITIPRQAIDGPGRDALAETLSFNPWHGLDAHRPLGGMNRVRRAVYVAISTLRHTMNGETPVEPAGFETADPSGL